MRRLDDIQPGKTISSLPYTISAPGRYTLSADNIGSSGQDGVTISSSDVVLDGQGFALRGVAGSLSGVRVEGVQRNVTIQNLTVTDWGESGVVSAQSPVRCVDATCRSNGGHGFFLQSAGSLVRCVAESNTLDGVRLRSSGGGTWLECFLTSVRCVGNGGNGLSAQNLPDLDCDDSVFSGNGGRGVLCVGGPIDKASPVLLRACVSSSNAGNGFEFDTAAATDRLCPELDRCVSSGNGGSGLVCGSTVTGLEMFRCVDSSFTGNGANGVHVAGGRIDKSTPLLFTRCVSSGNTSDGWQMLSARQYDKSTPKLMECVARSNGGDGMELSIVHRDVACRLSIEGGDCDDNDDNGLRVSSGDLDGDGRLDVVVAGFSASGNGQNGILGDTSVATKLKGTWNLKENKACRNGGSGLRVHGVHRGGDLPSVIDSFSSYQNGSHGIWVTGSSSASVSRCASSENGGVGMWMDCLSGVYTGNTTDGNTSSGLRLSGHEAAHVVQQSSSRNASHGQDIDDDCDGYSSSRCVSDSNGGDGFSVRSSSCVMDHNSSRSNKSSSISVGGGGGGGGGAASASYARLVGCSSSSDSHGSSGGAIYVDASSVFVASCVVTDADGDALVVSGATGGVVRDNVCSSNAGRGITINTSHVEYSTNRCVSNGTDGLHVMTGDGNVIRNNFVSNNTSGGLHLSSAGNRLFENSSGSGVNPLYEDGGISNDISSGGTASSSGPPNIGF